MNKKMRIEYISLSIDGHLGGLTGSERNEKEKDYHILKQKIFIFQ